MTPTSPEQSKERCVACHGDRRIDATIRVDCPLCAARQGKEAKPWDVRVWRHLDCGQRHGIDSPCPPVAPEQEAKRCECDVGMHVLGCPLRAPSPQPEKEEECKACHGTGWDTTGGERCSVCDGEGR